MNLQQGEGAVFGEVRAQRPGKQKQKENTAESSHAAVLTGSGAQHRATDAGGPHKTRGKEEKKKKGRHAVSKKASRSGFCAGRRGGQDVVALPSNILLQPK